MSNPSDQLKLCLVDENDEIIEKTVHICRPKPTPGTPEYAACIRDFAAKVAEHLEP